MQNFLMGLDIGTSSVKGILIDTEGKTRFTAKSEFSYTRKPDGTVEIPANRYYNACKSLFRRLTAKLPPEGKLLCINAASASGNTLLLDESGEPTTPIFNWQDTRVTDEVSRVLGADFDMHAYYERIGWPVDGKTFPLAHLSWLFCHEPDKLRSCAKVCMSTEYLYYMLTGCMGISTSAGAPSYLIDQVQGNYIQEKLFAFGITEEKLPPIMPVGTVVGCVTPKASEETGLPVHTPVICGTFDHPGAARGVGVLKEGQLLMSCGTSWVGFYPINDRDKAVHNDLIVDPFLSEKGGPWAGMTSLASVSAKIEAYISKYICRDGNIYAVFAAEAEKSSFGAGGLSIFFDQRDDEAHIRSYPACHIARAIMEAIIRMLKERFDLLEKGGVKADRIVMVGGPTECPLWADVIREITGLPVQIRQGAFAGALGAAMVGGISVGVYKDEEEAFSVLGA